MKGFSSGIKNLNKYFNQPKTQRNYSVMHETIAWMDKSQLLFVFFFKQCLLLCKSKLICVDCGWGFRNSSDANLFYWLFSAIVLYDESHNLWPCPFNRFYLTVELWSHYPDFISPPFFLDSLSHLGLTSTQSPSISQESLGPGQSSAPSCDEEAAQPCQWQWSHRSLSVPIRDQQGVDRSGKCDQGCRTLTPPVSAIVCVEAEAREGVLYKLNKSYTHFSLNHETHKWKHFNIPAFSCRQLPHLLHGWI